MASVSGISKNGMQCVLNGTTWTKICSRKYLNFTGSKGKQLDIGDPFTFYKLSNDLLTFSCLRTSMIVIRLR